MKRAEPAQQMTLQFSTTVIPQPDGSFVIRPIKPQPAALEYSPRSAAQKAGVSVWTIYRLIACGYIKARRPSPGKILIDAESLEEHLRATADPEFWQQRQISCAATAA